MKGSKEAQVGQWIFAIVACAAAFFEASETARTLFMFAFAFFIAECICKSIEWAAQERSRERPIRIRGRYEPGKTGPAFYEER